MSIVPFLIVMLTRKMVSKKKKKSQLCSLGVEKEITGRGKKWYTKTEGNLEG